MSKQVYLAGGRLRLNETALLVLGVIARNEGGPEKPAVISKSQFSRALGCSVGTIQRTILILEEKDLVQVVTQYAEDGGSKPNAYTLTTLGALAVEAAGEKASVVA